MFSLKAPHYDSEERENRAPLDLICIIDVSGSMHGEKIELMKKTLLFMIEQLKPMDKCAIVTFDSSVKVPLHMTAMDHESKKRAKEVIEAQRSGSCTNLSGGLLKGLEIMRDRKQPADVTSILLFTDGLANEGLTATDAIVDIVQKQLKEYGKHISLFSFGFGTDHNADMLRAIGESGGGLYYYVENVDQIPQTFSDCLGGLLSVLAQNIELKIETMDDEIKISKVHSTSYKINEIRPQHELELAIGDMYSEENRDIVLTVKLNSRLNPNEKQQLLKATLSYFNVIEKESQRDEVIINIERVESVPADQTPNPHLDLQRNRVECANSLDTARKFANDGKYEEAKQLLTNTCKFIEEASTGKEEFCQGLVADIRDCLSDLNSDRYESHCSKKMNTYCSASHHQRSTNDRSASQRYYHTSHKQAMEDASESFLDNM